MSTPYKINFDRCEYLDRSDEFQKGTIYDVSSELCEFNHDVEDMAYELAYTRYLVAVLELELGADYAARTAQAGEKQDERI